MDAGVIVPYAECMEKSEYYLPGGPPESESVQQPEDELSLAQSLWQKIEGLGFVETDQMKQLRAQLLTVENDLESQLALKNEYFEAAERLVTDDNTHLAYLYLIAALYEELGETEDADKALDDADMYADNMGL